MSIIALQAKRNKNRTTFLVEKKPKYTVVLYSNSGHKRTKIVLVSFNQPSVWGQLTLKFYSDFKWIAKVLVISIFDYAALCVIVWEFYCFFVVFARFMIVHNPDISWFLPLFAAVDKFEVFQAWDYTPHWFVCKLEDVHQIAVSCGFTQYRGFISPNFSQLSLFF